MQYRLKFQANWKVLFLGAVLVPLGLFLADWQLSRADEKKAILAAVQSGFHSPPLPLNSVSDLTTVNYLPVSAYGYYIAGQDFLLDNRMREGRVGYEVITPFQPQDGPLVLVNRGWVPATGDRRELPVVPVMEGPVALTGYLFRASETGLVLGSHWREPGWPSRIQSLDIPAIAEVMDQSLPPVVLRLDAGQPGGFQVGWPLINMGPEKHQAYAVQWMLLSLVVLVFVVSASLVRRPLPDSAVV